MHGTLGMFEKRRTKTNRCQTLRFDPLFARVDRLKIDSDRPIYELAIRI